MIVDTVTAIKEKVIRQATAHEQIDTDGGLGRWIGSRTCR